MAGHTIGARAVKGAGGTACGGFALDSPFAPLWFYDLADGIQSRGRRVSKGGGARPLWRGAAERQRGGAPNGVEGQAPARFHFRRKWYTLLHQLTDGVSRATLECSKERHGRLAEGSVIMHVTKYTKGTLGHMLGHYDRTKDGLGENVVPERTQLNYNLAVDDQPLKQLDFVHKRLGEVRCLKRKDVNVLCDWVVTMPKDLADEYREPFFKAAYNFFAEKYGHDNVVSAYVHMDEMQPHMHFAFVPVVADRKRDGWKLSAKEAITRVDLQHIHEQMQTQLTQELGVPVNLLNEATIEGNRSIKELKRGTAVEAVNKLKSEQMEIAQDITYLEDRQKAVADRYEADTFRLGVLNGEYTDGTDDLPEYAQISRLSRQKVVLPLDAYQREQRALKAAKTGEQAATAALESLMQSITVQHIDELEEKNKEQRKQIKKLTKELNDLKQDQEYDKIDLQIKKQIVDGINRVYWKLGLRASSEFIEAWKEEVHEKLPVTWQHMIDLSQEVAESRQRKSIKELREEADKLLGKSNKRKSRDFEQDHDWEM